jgi:hypothetical protein
MLLQRLWIHKGNHSQNLSVYAFVQCGTKSIYLNITIMLAILGNMELYITIILFLSHNTPHQGQSTTRSDKGS